MGWQWFESSIYVYLKMEILFWNEDNKKVGRASSSLARLNAVDAPPPSFFPINVMFYFKLSSNC